MGRSIDWSARIGRRLRLRDLHVLFAVVQQGSMARAGTHLGMSQSAVSQAVAALEATLQVRLLDRTPRGVEPTAYGAAVLRRGAAAFDELRLAVREVEALADPDAGEVRVACAESIAAGILPVVIERFLRRHPKVRLEVFQTTPHLTGFGALHERTADVVFTFSMPRPFEDELAGRLRAEVLFEDRICLAAHRDSPWARRRRIRPADLAGATLIAPSAGTPGGAAIVEALRGAGLPGPQLMTFSIHLRTALGRGGPFVSVMPASVLRFGEAGRSLKELRVDIQWPALPALVVTLRDRTLSPAVQRFIECAGEVGGGFGAR